MWYIMLKSLPFLDSKVSKVLMSKNSSDLYLDL